MTHSDSTSSRIWSYDPNDPVEATLAQRIKDTQRRRAGDWCKSQGSSRTEGQVGGGKASRSRAGTCLAGATGGAEACP